MITNYNVLCIKCRYEFQANDITFSNITIEGLLHYDKCLGCIHLFEYRGYTCGKTVTELDGLFYTSGKSVQSEAEFDFYYNTALKKKREIKLKREKEKRHMYV
jgi:hypothetical protein